MVVVQKFFRIHHFLFSSLQINTPSIARVHRRLMLTLTLDMGKRTQIRGSKVTNRHSRALTMGVAGVEEEGHNNIDLMTTEIEFCEL